MSGAVTVARGPVELDALEIMPGGRLLARVGGRAESLESRADRLKRTLDAPVTSHIGEPERALWSDAAEFAWLPEDPVLVRVGLSIRQVLPLDAALRAVTGVQVRYGIGGTVAWVSWPAASPLDDLDTILNELGLPAMVLVGPPGRPFLGPVTGGAFGERIVGALDPDSRFLEF